MCVEFGKHEFGEPKYTVDECKEKDVTYQAPLFVEIRFINRETGEIKEQEVFMGDFPLMTPRGTFIINGTERVVVSQLVRSPGVYFASERDKTSDKTIYNAKVIPSRGAWLEFETDKRDLLSATPPPPRKSRSSSCTSASVPASRRRSIPPARCSTACSSTRNAMTWPRSVATRWTRSSASPPRRTTPPR